MESTSRFPYHSSAAHQGILGNAAFVFHSLMIRQGPSVSLSECDSYFMPISIRLFWNFFLKPSNGLGLFVSTLHEAGSLLLFFLAPSCFLLSFLKGFTCHKNSLSVMDPLGHCPLCSRRCIMRSRL